MKARSFQRALSAKVAATRSTVAVALLLGLASASMAQPSKDPIATIGQGGTISGSAKLPEQTDIIPASGPAGQAYPLQATIRGMGFMPTGNIVEFGPVKIPDLPSPEGTRITFFIPKLIPSRGEVPPMVLQPGEYRVTVTTSAGTSNALIFALTRGP
jgi:hypothetical protein